MRKTLLASALFLALAVPARADVGRYAVVDSTGTVTNIVEWDGQAAWAPPPGSTAVPIPAGSTVGAGWTYANGVFTAPH